MWPQTENYTFLLFTIFAQYIDFVTWLTKLLEKQEWLKPRFRNYPTGSFLKQNNQVKEGKKLNGIEKQCEKICHINDLENI